MHDKTKKTAKAFGCSQYQQEMSRRPRVFFFDASSLMMNNRFNSISASPHRDTAVPHELLGHLVSLHCNGSLQGLDIWVGSPVGVMLDDITGGEVKRVHVGLEGGLHVG